MVSQVIDNSSALYFRVQWKFPKDQAERRDYYCKSLAELARILYHAEGITRETVEFIYIHEVKRDNTTAEVVAIDKGSLANINPQILHSSVAPPEDSEGADVKILSKVFNIIHEQRKSKPHIKLVTTDRPGTAYAAFGMYKSYPASPFVRESKK